MTTESVDVEEFYILILTLLLYEAPDSITKGVTEKQISKDQKEKAWEVTAEEMLWIFHHVEKVLANSTQTEQQQKCLSKRQNPNRCKLSPAWLWAADDTEVHQISELLGEKLSI